MRNTAQEYEDREPFSLSNFVILYTIVAIIISMIVAGAFYYFAPDDIDLKFAGIVGFSVFLFLALVLGILASLYSFTTDTKNALVSRRYFRSSILTTIGQIFSSAFWNFSNWV